MKVVQRTKMVEVEEFEIGDVISFELTTGQEVSAMAMRKEENGMLFVFMDLLDEYIPMNRSNSTEGGYEESYLRKVLNGRILKTFDADFVDKMIPFENGDLLRILTYTEVFGDTDGEGQLEPMKEARNRVAFKDGCTDWYWLQDVASATLFAAVAGYGCASSTGACLTYVGVRPAFLLS